MLEERKRERDDFASATESKRETAREKENVARRVIIWRTIGSNDSAVKVLMHLLSRLRRACPEIGIIH